MDATPSNATAAIFDTVAHDLTAYALRALFLLPKLAPQRPVLPLLIVAVTGRCHYFPYAGLSLPVPSNKLAPLPSSLDEVGISTACLCFRQMTRF